jgi:hypothetical protein
MYKADVIRVGREAGHPNLAGSFANFIAEKQMWVIMKLMDRGNHTRSDSFKGSMLDIIRYIDREKEKEDNEESSSEETIRFFLQHECPKDGLLTEKILATILKFALRGLEFLHSKSRVHRCAFLLLVNWQRLEGCQHFGEFSWRGRHFRYSWGSFTFFHLSSFLHPPGDRPDTSVLWTSDSVSSDKAWCPPPPLTHRSARHSSATRSGWPQR